MKNFKVFYDKKEDILYLGEEGIEEEYVEISPGVHVELDDSGNIIGVEIFKASEVLKDVIQPIREKVGKVGR